MVRPKENAMRRNVALVLESWERDSDRSGKSISTHSGTVWSYRTPILTREACVAHYTTGEWSVYRSPFNHATVYFNHRHYSKTTTTQQNSIYSWLRERGYRCALNESRP
jgi:hypothetical protein